MEFFLIFILPIILLSIVITIDNKKKQRIEELKNYKIDDQGNEKQICYWCKQQIEFGAKICPFCRKIPTKTGTDNNQVKILITIILAIIAFFLLFNIRIFIF